MRLEPPNYSSKSKSIRCICIWNSPNKKSSTSLAPSWWIYIFIPVQKSQLPNKKSFHYGINASSIDTSMGLQSHKDPVMHISYHPDKKNNRKQIVTVLGFDYHSDLVPLTLKRPVMISLDISKRT